MAEIVDANALKFVNERIRPLSEKLRQIEAEIESMEAAWFNGPNTILTGSDTVEDRTDEGLPVLTGDEVTNIVTALIAARDVVTETAGRASLVEKACVRPLHTD